MGTIYDTLLVVLDYNPNNSTTMSNVGILEFVQNLDRTSVEAKSKTLMLF